MKKYHETIVSENALGRAKRRLSIKIGKEPPLLKSLRQLLELVEQVAGRSTNELNHSDIDTERTLAACQQVTPYFPNQKYASLLTCSFSARKTTGRICSTTQDSSTQRPPQDHEERDSRVHRRIQKTTWHSHAHSGNKNRLCIQPVERCSRRSERGAGPTRAEDRDREAKESERMND